MAAVAACCAVLLAAVLFFSAPATTEAYDSLDPNGNITIKWDIIQWTPDGYVATVTMFNYQKFRHIDAPGWQLGWAWAKKEVIWSHYRNVTWNVICTYSQFLARKSPSCCVSLSSIYNNTIVSCPTCSCGCQHNCVNQPLVQCTPHMCPIKINWHVKLNYKDYWRVEVTITNFNYRMNYSDWNLVAQHPNFNNITKVFSFNYKPLTPYGGRINDTAMFWGMKFHNDLLNQAGPRGNVQSELVMRKDSETFTFQRGWAFPRRVYFNGDNCVMPSPDSYPWLPPNASPLTKQP